MAQKRLSVRKIREVLRLHFAEGRSNRQVATSIGKSASVVHDCLTRFRASGLCWPLPDDLDDEKLEGRLYPSLSTEKVGRRVKPDCVQVHKELSRKHVTLYLLWQEYKLTHGALGYEYSRFCELYHEWARPLGAVLRQVHKAGDKAFVDWSGDGIQIVDRKTGEVSEAPLFVAALGASGYTFAKAAPSRKSAHWLRLHSEAMAYFGGVTAAVVPDNERTGVTSPCRYDPDLNPVYAAWAEHYDTAVIPARPGKPKDKAVVENAVLNVQRWILAKLRNHTFFTLEQANDEIEKLLEAYNDRPLTKTGETRRALYESIDRPALRPLPQQRFLPFEWSRPTVNIDYHVLVEKHHYSAPYTLIGQEIEARFTHATVELWHQGQRIACHQRSFVLWGWTTLDAHRPEKHRTHLAWTPERIISWAEKTGPHTAMVAQQILGAKRHPEQGYRACLGVMRLGKRYGDDRLEAACCRALALRSPSYHTVSSILKTGADRLALPPSPAPTPNPLTLPEHDNIRGATYYN